MDAGRSFEKRHRKSKSNTQSNGKMDCGPKYSKVSESLRYVTSGSVQCSMFCGGRQCKYEGPAKWTESEMAIKGLYSSWVTDNILAMARPSTRIIKQLNIIQQFQRWGITAVINLQHPGEHANCGFGLEKGGFSYNPEDFMDNGIFFYNFIWQDYGVRSLESVLDMVKVMDFALHEGKVSVHCHAGLGRTGVLIACYLIFSLRMTPEQAIHTVRRKRPKSVQTRGQISCVQDFAKFLKPLWVIFPSCYTFGVKLFTLEKYLIHQRHMLHGYEARELKYVPKIIFASCKRILELCGIDSSNLKLTENRITDKRENEMDEKDLVCNMENALNFEGQLAANISASLEDLKGEYDDCDIPVNAVSDGFNKSLSSSQPSGLLSFQNQSLSLQEQLRKSDSVLFKVHSKQVGKETVLKQPESDQETETDINYHGGDVLQFAVSKETKMMSPTNLNHEPKILNDNNNTENPYENSTDTEQATMAFSSDNIKENGITMKVQTLQRILNESNEGWKVLEEESDLRVITGLIFSWITTLAEPVLSASDLQNLVDGSDEPRKALLLLTRAQRGICECLFVTIFKLDPVSKELREKALLKIINILTHTSSQVNVPRESNQTKTEQPSQINTDKESGSQVEHSRLVSLSLVVDFSKFLTSLYQSFLNDVR